MTQEVCLKRHPYLRPVAELQTLVDTALAELPIPSVCIPAWDVYVADFHAGVTLLPRPSVAMDLVRQKRVVTSLVERLASKALPVRLKGRTVCGSIIVRLVAVTSRLMMTGKRRRAALKTGPHSTWTLSPLIAA